MLWSPHMDDIVREDVRKTRVRTTPIENHTVHQPAVLSESQPISTGSFFGELIPDHTLRVKLIDLSAGESVQAQTQ